jgi:uncharacterized protein YndB with AHSA1/START domain
MTTLHHAIKIAAPKDKVFRALTDISEFAEWHYEAVEGEIAVGADMTMNAKPGMRFRWKTLELVENARIVQEGIEGPGESGKQIIFDLSDTDGGTLVQLTDGEWKESDPSMAFCNTHWGAVLTRLKAFVEGS